MWVGCLAEHPAGEMSSKGRLGDLTDREQDQLKMRRDSDTKAAELVKMEKMLQQTKGIFEKKAESSSETKNYEENMGLYLHSYALCTWVYSVIM